MSEEFCSIIGSHYGKVHDDYLITHKNPYDDSFTEMTVVLLATFDSSMLELERMCIVIGGCTQGAAEKCVLRGHYDKIVILP